MAQTTKARPTVVVESCCFGPLSAALGEEDAAALARLLTALADPVRLRLVSLLASAPGGEVCACDLVAPLGRSQPTVSHHLKVLTEAGLITSERRGRWIWYSVVSERIDGIRKALATS